MRHVTASKTDASLPIAFVVVVSSCLPPTAFPRLPLDGFRVLIERIIADIDAVPIGIVTFVMSLAVSHRPATPRIGSISHGSFGAIIVVIFAFVTGLVKSMPRRMGTR